MKKKNWRPYFIVNPRILETHQKLKQRYYWPNMYHDIQKVINNCEICQNNKYERKLFQIDDNLTQTPIKPFQKINIDTLTLEKKLNNNRSI